jgi:TPR repeat protein
VTIDFSKSLEWARKAAVEGDAMSENTVGYSLLIGRAVAQDVKEACVWPQLAYDRADPGELKDRARVNLMNSRARLTEEQDKSCTQEAAKWQTNFLSR